MSPREKYEHLNLRLQLMKRTTGPLSALVLELLLLRHLKRCVDRGLLYWSPDANKQTDGTDDCVNATDAPVRDAD